MFTYLGISKFHCYKKSCAINVVYSKQPEKLIGLVRTFLRLIFPKEQKVKIDQKCCLTSALTL